MKRAPAQQSQRWLAAGVALLLLLLYTRISDLPGLDALPVSVTQCAVALLLAGVLLDRLVIRRLRFAWHPLIGWFLVYGAAIAVSIVSATDRVATAAALVAYLREVLIVLLLLNLVSSAANLRVAVWSLAGGGGILAAAAVVQAFTGFDTLGLSTLAIQTGGSVISVRLDGPIGLDSNEFARLLAMSASLALYLAWTERRRLAQLTALLLLVLVSVTAMWTFSRGGFLGLVFALAAAAVLQRRRVARLAVVGLVGAAVAIGAPGLYWDRLGLTAGDAAIVAAGRMPSSVAARPTPAEKSASVVGSAAALIAAAEQTHHDAPPPGSDGDTVAGRGRTDDSIFVRWSLARVGAQMFLDRPLTGVGKGNYLAVYPQYSARIDPALPSVALGPHNTFVQIAAESGAHGLLTFIAVLIAAWLTLRSARRRLRQAGLEREAMLLEGVGIAVGVYLVTGMFLNDTVYQRYLWLLLGLVAAGDRLAPRATLL